MTFKDDFNEAVKRWMNNHPDRAYYDKVDKVLEWYERPGWGGGCDTCGYGEDRTKIEIRYLNQFGEELTHEFETTFSDMLSELLRD